MEARDGDIVIHHGEQTPEGFVKELNEARRYAQLLRSELVDALKALDELDKIVDKAQQPTLFEEDYHAHAFDAHGALWDGLDTISRAIPLGHKAYKHIFAILRVFMHRRWREIQAQRKDETPLNEEE